MGWGGGEEGEVRGGVRGEGEGGMGGTSGGHALSSLMYT